MTATHECSQPIIATCGRRGGNCQCQQAVECMHEAMTGPNQCSPVTESLLREVLTELAFARVFITSREKMHPCGVDLYDELTRKVEAALGNPGDGAIYAAVSQRDMTPEEDRLVREALLASGKVIEDIPSVAAAAEVPPKAWLDAKAEVDAGWPDREPIGVAQASPVRAALDILNAVAPAVENLACHQEQCDMDGCMVKVSRQALDETLAAVNEVAITLALANASTVSSTEQK